MKHPLKPMLVNAEHCHTSNVFIQPKLDGIRAVWNPSTQTLSTRTGGTLTSLPYIVEALSHCDLGDLPLDGEIYSHGLPLSEISSLVMRRQCTTGSPLLEFHIFDFADPDLDQMERVEILNRLQENKFIKRVQTSTAKTWLEIKAFYQGFLADGYEGIILRTKMALYTPGKKFKVFKIKPVFDVEAELVDFVPASPGSRNENTFGSIMLRLPNGLLFGCSGFSDKQRQQIWDTMPIGESVTVEYSSLSTTGIPLQPRFKGIRKDLVNRTEKRDARS